ncbi:MAG: GNAT family protein [Chloroflexota bacterium]
MITLKPATPADIPFIVAAEQHDDITPYIIPWAQQEHRHSFEDADIQYFMVMRSADGATVGYVILAGLKDIHDSIEFQRLVITEQGQGYGNATMAYVKRYAFTELNAHRLWLDVKEHNTLARRLYEKHGFIVEGTLRECLKVNDQYQSLVVMSLLKNEYLAQV